MSPSEVFDISLAEHEGANTMSEAQEFDLQQMEERAAAEFPEVLEALKVFEISFAQYIQAFCAQEPRVLYSASSTQED